MGRMKELFIEEMEANEQQFKKRYWEDKPYEADPRDFQFMKSSELGFLLKDLIDLINSTNKSEKIGLQRTDSYEYNRVIGKTYKLIKRKVVEDE